jgi:hypothetical protein
VAFKAIRLGTDRTTLPGRDWGVWSDTATDIYGLPGDAPGCTIADGLTERDAKEFAEAWNFQPWRSPENGQFHDPTFFGLIDPRKDAR